MAYTPLQPGQAPTFGSSGQAVLQLQNQLNTQNAGKPGWVPLKEDALYGPLTQAGANWKPQSQLAVTAGPAKTALSNYSGQLSGFLNELNSTQGATSTRENPDTAALSDPFIQQLEKHKQTSDDATKMLISTIQAATQNQKGELAKTYDSYKRGLQLLGIQHNQAQFTPDLLAGHILEAQNEYRTKVSALDAEQAKELMDAKVAQDNSDLSTLKQKMERVKQIKQEKNDALKDLYDKMSTEQKIGDIQAHTIYDQLQKLNASEKEIFLQAVAKKYGIPLQTLVQSVADEATARTKASTKGEKQTAAEKESSTYASINQLFTAGSKSSDGMPYIDDNGYAIPKQFKKVMAAAREAGISRADFIAEYANLIYIPEAAAYGLTPGEIKKLKGEGVTPAEGY